MPWLTTTIRVSVISLLWLLPGPISLAHGLGNFYGLDLYDIDPYDTVDDVDDDYENMLIEMDTLGLDFDSPEVQGMDNNQIWDYIIGIHTDRQNRLRQQVTPP